MEHEGMRRFASKGEKRMSSSKQYTKEEKKELHLKMMFSLMKKRASVVDRDSRFSGTEFRLLAEILAAKYEGRRLISTQIADVIGVTRSAVSQIVNRLEAENIVKRVPDDVDRKIAYIEVTDNALELYRADLENCKDYVEEIVECFGEDKFHQLCELFEEFISYADAVHNGLKSVIKPRKRNSAKKGE